MLKCIESTNTGGLQSEVKVSTTPTFAEMHSISCTESCVGSIKPRYHQCRVPMVAATNRVQFSSFSGFSSSTSVRNKEKSCVGVYLLVQTYKSSPKDSHTSTNPYLFPRPSIASGNFQNFTSRQLTEYVASSHLVSR